MHHKCNHTKLLEQSKQIHSGLAWPWEVGGENDARNGTVVEDVIWTIFLSEVAITISKKNIDIFFQSLVCNTFVCLLIFKRWSSIKMRISRFEPMYLWSYDEISNFYQSFIQSKYRGQNCCHWLTDVIWTIFLSEE